MYTYIVLSIKDIPIYIKTHTDLDTILDSLNDYLSGENNVIGYDEQWNYDDSLEPATFLSVYKWILSNHRVVYFGTNYANIQNFKQNLSLARSLKMLFSKDILYSYISQINDLSNVHHLSQILRFSNLSDAYIMLKSLFSVNDVDMKQACIYLLNTLIEMYKDEGEKINTETIPELVTCINKHVFKGSVLSSKLKAITTVYINMKISTASTVRLK